MDSWKGNKIYCGISRGSIVGWKNNSCIINNEQVRKASAEIKDKAAFVRPSLASVDLEVTTWSKDSHGLYDYEAEDNRFFT